MTVHPHYSRKFLHSKLTNWDQNMRLIDDFNKKSIDSRWCIHVYSDLSASHPIGEREQVCMASDLN